MRFSQNNKKIMVYHLKLKKAQINGLNFWEIQKSPIFPVHTGFSPPHSIFSKKSGSTFYPSDEISYIFNILPPRPIWSRCSTKISLKVKKPKSIELDINNLCDKQ